MTGFLVVTSLVVLVVLVFFGRRAERRAWAACRAAWVRDSKTRAGAVWSAAAPARSNPAGEIPLPAGPQVSPPGDTAADIPCPLWVSAAAPAPHEGDPAGQKPRAGRPGLGHQTGEVRRG